MSGIDDTSEHDFSAETRLNDSPGDHIGDWDLRPWVLGVLLALAGLGLHFVTDGWYDYGATGPEPWRAALATFLFFGGIAAAFTLDRGRLLSAAIFSLLIGFVMGGIAWNVARLQDHIADGNFTFAAGIFFSLLALPLFQAGFHKTRFDTDYRTTHFHVWADAISGAGALAFTGLSWLLLLLLDQLFGLLGIDLIGDMMGESWFGWVWSAGAFGAALGVLRENLKIIGTLQNVVMLVFALLAVPLAAALLIFLVLLLASGGTALWEATDSATPILLACAAGAFILCNAIIRDDDEARSKNVVMLAAALVLAAVILPLVVFAAIGMGLRIDQRGLSPERIWALIAIAVAAAYGIAAWVGIARGRIAGWAGQLRAANLHLAVVMCALAFVLALPLWDFGAVAARNQVARLEAGKVTPDEFDFTALRWDFGDSGRAVLARLAQGDGEAARLAKLAQKQVERPWDWNRGDIPQGFTGEVRVESDDPALEPLVRAYLEANPWECDTYCVAVDLGETAGVGHEVALVQTYGYQRVVVGGETGAGVQSPAAAVASETRNLDANSKVELRTETTRYIYVDGVRRGEPVD